MTHVLSHEPDGAGWAGARGLVTRELIAAHCAPPSESTAVFVCGPPPMYDALCGPRGEPEIAGALAELGYARDQVFKF